MKQTPRRLLPSVLAVLGAWSLGCNQPKPEVSLAAPPSGQGFQFQTGGFAVPQGTETQRCYFFAVPGTPDQEVWVNHYQLAQNQGSHHVNIFRVNTIVNLSGQPGDVVVDGQCWTSSNWSDWPLVVNSQDDAESVDWTLPAGVGAKFHGGDLLMMQVHFVNATTQKTPREGLAFANFWTMTTPPPNELGTIFATNQNIRICPGDTDKSFEARCTFQSEGITVVAANGHFHSRGIDFQIAPVDSSGDVGSMFYHSTTWNEPPMVRGLDVQIGAGGGIDYRCAYTAPANSCGDPKDNCCFTFGGHVETQEHCNAFVYYYPKVSDVSCF
jgi:hypothetical protein